VLLNTNDRDVVMTDFKLDGRRVGLKPVRRVLDAETNQPVGKAYDRAKRQYVWGEHKPYHLILRGHDYRVLVLE
jgi:hypothetical protein